MLWLQLCVWKKSSFVLDLSWSEWTRQEQKLNSSLVAESFGGNYGLHTWGQTVYYRKLWMSVTCKKFLHWHHDITFLCWTTMRSVVILFGYIRCKLNIRWQHILSQMNTRFFKLVDFFLSYKMQQATSRNYCSQGSTRKVLTRQGTLITRTFLLAP